MSTNYNFLFSLNGFKNDFSFFECFNLITIIICSKEHLKLTNSFRDSSSRDINRLTNVDLTDLHPLSTIIDFLSFFIAFSVKKTELLQFGKRQQHFFLRRWLAFFLFFVIVLVQMRKIDNERVKAEHCLAVA